MTGYAEKSFVHETFSVKIKIRTLNHRFFDWNYRGSPLGVVEDILRNLCQKKLSRGRIESSVDISFLSPEKWNFRINVGLLKKILSSFEKTPLVSRKNVTFSLESLLNIPHVVEFRRKAFTKEETVFLQESFEKTLDQLIKQRMREGKEIKNQLRMHMRNIRTHLQSLEKQAKKQPLLIRNKLKERIKELNQETSLSENKLAEEASFLAQRYDLTEEIVRLKSHLGYMQELIDQVESEPAGKKMDFVAQELFREANTVNSKAQDIKVIRESLAIKAEIESIRQQVQNIE
jgi:uncharacterized protein (TIGR00255 family)